ncbi:MAG: arginine--tRNA ligase [bacterium]
MIRQEIKKITEKALKELHFVVGEVKLEHPEDKIHGDYATNVAMVVAKTAKKNPIEIAEEIKYKIQDTPKESKLPTGQAKYKILERVEVVKPGFINFFVSKEYLQKQVEEILKKGNRFGSLKIGKGKKVNVEFISANPTGPLTLGNGRGGFCGDVLTNVLLKAGYKAEREYYVNDTGVQVRKLGHSVIGGSEAVYQGRYIEELRKKIKGENPDKVGEKAAKEILEKMIRPAVKKMGIKYNTWFSEKSLYRKKETDKALDYLKKKKLTYEKEGALWFKSTKFGDDKDRVLIKADGQSAYFLSDIAYLKNKFRRGFEKLIFFWGADHYGYINRLKGAAAALGYNKERIDIVIIQLVKLYRGGKEVRMSKRAGIYITLDELIDEVGLDVARFFFLARASNSHLNFDLSLAKERSEKNPVYYVQYAHARICSILKKSKIQNPKSKIQNLKLLNHPSEFNLIKQLIRLPEIIEDTAKDYQVQRLPQYVIDLATSFHQFYRDCRVISDNKELTKARLALVLATKIVLKSALDLMGISAPEKM